MAEPTTARPGRIHAGAQRNVYLREATDYEGEGWPTTKRFSRRLGEALPGADYARAFEPPRTAGHRAAMRTLRSMLVIASFALVLVLAIAPWLAR
jgi:ferric-dicitrate binding protein FerR (iron transport regulator)